MFKSFPRRTVKTLSVALAGIAITVCSAGTSEAATVSKETTVSKAATVSKATTWGIVEKWVYITTYSGAAPGEEAFLCGQAGQSYINEGLASQYECSLSKSGDALYILTLAG